ncbi:hypothetical protein AB0M41_23970 [Streptomyces sp. NPDC051896]|uniref:hypothetical protein n=1 Tax=Streptomyces sp. NPDC051896 TaxID=3155416 RepID=UPI00343BC97A
MSCRHPEAAAPTGFAARTDPGYPHALDRHLVDAAVHGIADSVHPPAYAYRQGGP